MVVEAKIKRRVIKLDYGEIIIVWPGCYKVKSSVRQDAEDLKS